MSQIDLTSTSVVTLCRASSRDEASGSRGATRFAIACAGVIASAGILAGWAPIGFSIAIVFLFAGPHNWMEARYFLSQMPAHWGPLRAFFTIGIGGVLVLTIGFAAMSKWGQWAAWEGEHWDAASSVWMTAFIGWIVTLTLLRSRQKPTRDWTWCVPIAFVLVALVWLAPQPWEVAMVYLHPLVALWFLDRTIGKRKPEWRRTYRTMLLLVPVVLTMIWIHRSGGGTAIAQDMLSMRITHHAGARYLENVSPRTLVATHTFLEMLHYGAWIVAIPLIGLRQNPLSLKAIPLVRRSPIWKRVVTIALAIGVLVVVALWASFLSDYSTTRDVYFTIAMAHVLMEVPFLLRTL